MTTITGSGIRFDGVAQNPRGGPIPNATVTICTATATGQPCSPLATTFSDATLTTACTAGSQIVLSNTSSCVSTGDGIGNFGFWVPAGDYIYTITGPGITGQTYAVTLGTNLTTAGPTPWADITASPYNAKCDGVTDDSAALLAAIDALNVGSIGGTIKFPRGKTCLFAQQILRDNLINIVFSGYSDGAWATLQTNHSFLKFSSATASPLSLRNCIGCKLEGITIQCTNATMTGICVSFDAVAGGNNQSQFVVLQDVTILGDSGTGNNPHTGILVSMNKSINMTIRNSYFSGGVVGLAGAVNPGDLGIGNLKLENVGFGLAGACTISGTMIQNPGFGIHLDTVDFELGNCSPGVKIIGIANAWAGPMNVQATSIFVGDQAGGIGNPSATLFTIPGGASNSLKIISGQLGPNSSNTTLFSLGASANLSVDGVLFTGATMSTFLNITSGGTGVYLGPNNNYSLATITTFMSGTPQSGLIWDNSVAPLVTIYQNGNAILATSASATTLTGSIAVVSNSPIILASNEQLLEIAAPAGSAGRVFQWADSGDHMLKYNPNNAGEQHVPQTIILTAQYTNSTTGFTTVGTPNLSFPVNANQKYTVTCHLYYQAAATGGLAIQFTGPAAPTAVSYGANIPISSTTFAGDAVATAFGTTVGNVAVTTATTNFDAIVSLALVNGANAGTVTLQAHSVAAVQLQIQTGSYCVVQ